MNQEMLALRSKLHATRALHTYGKISDADLFAVVDEYIAFIQRMKKSDPKKFKRLPIPTRTDILRKV